MSKAEHEIEKPFHLFGGTFIMAEFDLNANFIPALYKSSAELPIAEHRQSLLYVIETYPVTIIVGQTGCGKTTQIPQFLERGGWCNDGKMIAVTQVCEFDTAILSYMTIFA